MSNCDGWPMYRVEAEHLPDRRMKLWLREGPTATELGIVDRNARLYPIAEAWVAAHLGPHVDQFFVELHVPRPPDVLIGARVVAEEDDGRLTDGIVCDWVDGGVYVVPRDLSLGGGGIFGLDRLTFPRDGETPGHGQIS